VSYLKRKLKGKRDNLLLSLHMETFEPKLKGIESLQQTQIFLSL